ncbi:MAG: acetoacetate--CoA ligase [Acidimicrobiales bacterium]|nr:acetoacetate--CoA ligase [Acidimicrobiales bacterium]
MDRSDVLWSPPADVLDTSAIGRFVRWLETRGHGPFAGYHQLWSWSVDDLDGFWGAVWDHFAVDGGRRAGRALESETMPGARWFPGSTLNYAAEAFRRADGGAEAVISRVQGEPDRRLTFDDLAAEVARCQAGLRSLGVGRGDAVVGYVGNRVEALVAFLAAAGLGAVWASCPPEFGVTGAVARLGQVEPKVVVATAGYRYGAKLIDRRDDLDRIVDGIGTRPSVVLVDVPGIERPSSVSSAGAVVSWSDLLSVVPGLGPSDLVAEPVPFDHPLYVLFSSGTTGPPKAIVHGHGGIVVEHIKALALHLDLGPGDRFFWFSTTGWMMWNFLVSGLLVGSTIVLFDGDPGSDDLDVLWAMAAELGISFFGTSAPFLLTCRDRGLDPSGTHDLTSVRGVGSTGAPLPAEGFRWVYEHVSPTGLLSSISGGTDVCTAFLGAVPLLAVRAGRIPCRLLGCAVESLGTDGEPVRDEPGELVVTRPMPSMPVGFWNDPDGSRYRAAYFEERPGIWTHGDWISIADDGSSVISGRSDATLNRGGVRLGTAELYSLVEDRAEVEDSLVVHLEDPAGGPGELILFVVPGPGHELTDDDIALLKADIRADLSPRHVPDEVHVVGGIPRTRSGKKIEVPVKRILLGAATSDVVGPDALTDASLLAPFEDLARRRGT